MKQVVWMILARLADIVSTLALVRFATEVNPINNILLKIGFIPFIIYQVALGGILIFITSNMTGNYQKVMFWIIVLASFGVAINNAVGYFLFV